MPGRVRRHQVLLSCAASPSQNAVTISANLPCQAPQWSDTPSRTWRSSNFDVAGHVAAWAHSCIRTSSAYPHCMRESNLMMRPLLLRYVMPTAFNESERRSILRLTGNGAGQCAARYLLTWWILLRSLSPMELNS